MFATHDAKLQELQDDINSIQQEVAMLQEDVGELFQRWRGLNSAGSGWSEQMEEGVGRGSGDTTCLT